MRKSDAHILTVDHWTYINDDRFFVIEPEREVDENAFSAAALLTSKNGTTPAPKMTTGSSASRRRRVLASVASQQWTLHIRYCRATNISNLDNSLIFFPTADTLCPATVGSTSVRSARSPR